MGEPVEQELRLLVADEVAATLRVARSTVYDWTRRGILPCVVLRTAPTRAVRRWLQSDIEAFIESSRRDEA